MSKTTGVMPEVTLQENPVLPCGVEQDKPLSEYRVPVAVGMLSKDEFDAEIQKGYDDFLAGRSIPADKVFGELEREFGLSENVDD